MRYASYKINDVSAESGISSVWILLVHLKKIFEPYLSFFRFSMMILSNTFILCTSAALSTVIGEVTNYMMHRIFNTNIQYSNDSFVLKSDDNSVH